MRWLIFLLAATAAFAADTLLHFDFENGQTGWMVMGPGGSLRVSREGADSREDKPSLALDYEIGAQKFGVAALPVQPGSLSRMDQVHFWVRTDYPTSVAVTLGEPDHANYTAMAWSPGNAWQEVRLELRDFALDDKKAPPGAAAGPDPARIQGIVVTDLAEIFGGAHPNPNMPFAVTSASWKHSLLVNSFEVVGGTSPRQDNLVIDQFDAPQLSWSSPGGATFRLDNSRDHAPGPALEVDYTQTAQALVLFGSNLPPEIPPNITHIGFDIASEKAGQFIFALQERGDGHGEGPRYQTIVEVNGKPDHRDLALSAFRHDENGPSGATDELHIERAKTLSIADISPAANNDTGPNKFWISNLRFVALP